MISPFTKEENNIMNNLIEAYNGFIKLDDTHPTANTEFCNAIHICQLLLEHRILQREYPKKFPIIK